MQEDMKIMISHGPWVEQNIQPEERRYGRRYEEQEWGEINVHTRTRRLDFSRFDGDNPTGWIYKVAQFFDHYQTAARQRLRMATFHMEGEALIRFQDSEECGYFTH